MKNTHDPVMFFFISLFAKYLIHLGYGDAACPVFHAEIRLLYFLKVDFYLFMIADIIILIVVILVDDVVFFLNYRILVFLLFAHTYLLIRILFRLLLRLCHLLSSRRDNLPFRAACIRSP